MEMVKGKGKGRGKGKKKKAKPTRKGVAVFASRFGGLID